MAFQPTHDIHHTLQDMALKSQPHSLIGHYLPSPQGSSHTGHLAHSQACLSLKVLWMVTPPGMPLPGRLKGLALEYHLQERLFSPLYKEAPVISTWHYVLFFIYF